MDHILSDYIELVDRAGLSQTEEFRGSFDDALLYSRTFGALKEGGGEIIAFPGELVVRSLDAEGDLEETVPSISIEYKGSELVLTWRLARALSVALGEIETVARRG